MSISLKVAPCTDGGALRSSTDVPPDVIGSIHSVRALTGWAKIRELVHSGRITAADGAQLLDLRRLLAWRRRPWWDRLITGLLGGGP